MSALHKVLVVDDDPVVGKSFDRVLSSKGYVVTSVENAHDALERLRDGEFDLVVTDIKMPGMDGLELAETVKARRPWTPVLIITGYGTDEDEKRARAAGVTAFLHKPLSPETIEGSAAEALHVTMPTAAASAVVVPMPTSAVEAAGVETVAEAATEAVTEAAAGVGSRIRDIALFLAAPFIGLVYAVFMPFVGIGMALWYGAKALARSGALARTGEALLTVAKFALAPFIGLAYVVVGPFVGLATLLWMAGKAMFTPRHGG